MLFLELNKSGKDIIKLDIQRLSQQKLPNMSESSFANNFSEMSYISDDNHGKIFEEKGGYIEIWKPVRSLVSEYERTVAAY